MFLPPYCPFYNPIEMLFGTVKRALRRIFTESNVHQLTDKQFKSRVCAVFAEYRRYPLLSYYKHCGYSFPGRFDWLKAYKKGVRTFEQYHTHEGSQNAAGGVRQCGVKLQREL